MVVRVWGVRVCLVRVQLLVALLHIPLPGKVDSMCVAGLADLLRSKGLWLASVRYGYLYGGLKTAGNLGELCDHDRIWNARTLREVADEFEAAWTEVVSKGKPSRTTLHSGALAVSAKVARTASESTVESPDTDSLGSSLGSHTSDGPPQPAAAAKATGKGLKGLSAGKTASVPTAYTMASFREDMVEIIRPVMRQMLLSAPFSLPMANVLDDPNKAIDEFVTCSVDAFLGQDLYTAARQLLGNAKGSFGLVISHSLDSANEVVVAARGQTMALAFYPQMGMVLFGSEATATKVRALAPQ